MWYNVNLPCPGWSQQSIRQVQYFFRLKKWIWVIHSSKYFIPNNIHRKNPYQRLSQAHFEFSMLKLKTTFPDLFLFWHSKTVAWKSTWLVFFHFSSDLFCAYEIKEEGSSIIPAAAGVLTWEKIFSRPFLTQIHPQLCQLLTAQIWGRTVIVIGKITLRGLFWSVEPWSSLYNATMK